MGSSVRLAIRGGDPAVPAGTVQPWPPIDQIDREMVLASLQGGRHTFGPNCTAFQDEFAAWNGNRHDQLGDSGAAYGHLCLRLRRRG
jgi:dTDP-4-amino-4,6-dideoxygalactose transaminase